MLTTELRSTNRTARIFTKSATDRISGSCETDAVFTCKFSKHLPTIGVFDPHLLHLGIGKNRIMVTFPETHSAFYKHVTIVLKRRSEKHVRGVATLAVVATGAIVTNHHPVRYRTVHYLPRNPVGLLRDSVERNAPVPSVERPNPQPARPNFAGSVNPLPKPINLKRSSPPMLALATAKQPATIADSGWRGKKTPPAMLAGHFNHWASGCDMLFVRHLMASSKANEVRRARTVSAVPGFSLPQLYQMGNI